MKRAEALCSLAERHLLPLNLIPRAPPTARASSAAAEASCGGRAPPAAAPPARSSADTHPPLPSSADRSGLARQKNRILDDSPRSPPVLSPRSAAREGTERAVEEGIAGSAGGEEGADLAVWGGSGGGAYVQAGEGKNGSGAADKDGGMVGEESGREGLRDGRWRESADGDLSFENEWDDSVPLSSLVKVGVCAEWGE